MNPEAETPKGDLRRASITSITAMMEEYSTLLPYFTYGERSELDALLKSVVVPVWTPFEGPQTVALECPADELFYGGAAGGGKTDLLLGVALNRHHTSIIFRREYAELSGLRERSFELFEGIGRFNGKFETWKLSGQSYDKKQIQFGACQHVGDETKFQGRPHDLVGFDEITQFTEEQFRFLITWNRTTRRGQRSRVIATGNPPVTAEGRWVIKYWAPWLDPHHPNPAKQGELRWFITGPDGRDKEVGGPEPVMVKMSDGEEEEIEPKSRTFIRARVEDNPRLMETGYRRTLQNLPEPLRSRMLKGDFGVGHEDVEWQVIPTDWIVAAQSRWAPTFEEYLQKQHRRRWEKARASHLEQSQLVPQPQSGVESETDIDASKALEDASFPEFQPLPDTEVARIKAESIEKLSAVGVDVSRGGKDDTILSDRIDTWFASLIAIPGVQTTDGSAVIQKIIDLNFAKRKIQIDVIGVGTSPVDLGKMYEMDVTPMINSGKSFAKDRSGKLKFVNLRAEWWWRFREALDPSFDSEIALPPDPDMLADLISPVWKLTPRGIAVEPKEHIKARLKRSPDRGDATVLAHAQPYTLAEDYLKYMKELAEESKNPKQPSSSQNQNQNLPSEQSQIQSQSSDHPEEASADGWGNPSPSQKPVPQMPRMGTFFPVERKGEEKTFDW